MVRARSLTYATKSVTLAWNHNATRVHKFGTDSRLVHIGFLQFELIADADLRQINVCWCGRCVNAI